MLYRLTKIVSAPFLHLLWPTEVSGTEHVPRTGPAILASNHLSVLDSTFLPLVLPRQVRFVAKSEYFTGNPITAAYMRATGQISIDRQSPTTAQDTLDAAARVLREGDLFGIYPEGTRSPDGRLYRGKVGASWLALATGAPVIPVAMSGTDKVLPIGASTPKLGRVGVRIGKPMTFSGSETSARDRRQVTDEIMAAIQELSGQEYVPSYAPRRTANE
ncbi:1-acyl-sn-glycerol-3-phosphate acyltransferase [Streptosporangium sp. NBC_01639]|uniref:lysophospholipid acyltransferase family protein n=1 Tax=unclassified Streptosporangium TaxID=2632669 RepID=UPI002DDA6D03|nr:lysophospholipid acyltransferase family protein [Streptosporangium sp. NBC_01756]WSC86126.1 1-acyl-sn-glycerol-3-phosphate acyltransferase [Streptosporangium sp. NBC_01756]WTD55199.1 1-acyl-sn-glycerol-3-phosphate acyltransferase [Streptosporangium sp. NBC_01639]